jgi:hypothetical protein
VKAIPLPWASACWTHGWASHSAGVGKSLPFGTQTHHSGMLGEAGREEDVPIAGTPATFVSFEITSYAYGITAGSLTSRWTSIVMPSVRMNSSLGPSAPLPHQRTHSSLSSTGRSVVTNPLSSRRWSSSIPEPVGILHERAVSLSQ